jgi:hypothetical protein
MKSIALYSALVLALVVGAYLAWTWVYPSGTLRYRLTIEAEADGRPVTGSGVIEVTYRKADFPLSSVAISTAVKGEAVAVDLGPRGILFVVLTGPPGTTSADPPTMAVRTFNLAPSVGSLTPQTLRRLGTLTARAEIPANLLPMMVRFRDASDPKSVELVEPGALAKTFGTGVRFLRATAETTREQITTGVDARLPWLRHHRGSLIKDLSLPYDHYARQITEGSFSIGVR